MKEKIELFKMTLERNEIVRIAFNNYQKHKYHYYKYIKGKNNANKINKIKNLAIKVRESKLKQFAFSKKHFKRRRELRHLLKTKQYKTASNKIEYIIIKDKKYSIKDMKRIIQDYEIEQILLNNN